MNFRDDIDIENTWVTSDQHFGHENIIGFAHRPGDHESVMLERWAQAVPEDATVLHLGDISYRNNARFKGLIAPHLTGSRKLLIAGNHDRQRKAFYMGCGFQPVRPFQIAVGYAAGRIVQVEPGHDDARKNVSFSHYPWGADDGPMTDFDLRIHGHIHNNGYFREAFVPFLKGHINVSVEQTKYRPVNLANLLSGCLLGTMQVDNDDVQAGFSEEDVQSVLKNIERSRNKPC